MKAKHAKFWDDGVMVLDKPVDITSYQALAKVKRKLCPARIGHTGTLDPFATGVLVLLFNQATRLAEVFGVGEKTYVGVLRMGCATDSGDFTGQIIKQAEVPNLDMATIENAMAEIVGVLMQSPPMYSAAKHQGKPLYSYARQGEKINKPPRQVLVKSASLLAYENESLSFKITCGSGVYVRSWAEDLAAKLGTVGHLSALRREKNGPFKCEDALSLGKIEDLNEVELRSAMMPTALALNMLGAHVIRVDAEEAFKLRQGAVFSRLDFINAPPSGLAYVLDGDEELVAVMNFLDINQHDAGKDYETIRVFHKNIRVSQ